MAGFWDNVVTFGTGFIAAALGGPIGAIAGISKLSEQKAVNDKAALDKALAEKNQEAHTNAYTGAVAYEKLQYDAAVEQANLRAAEVEHGSQLGFRGSAEQTYLGGLQAASQIGDMAQQNRMGLGQITAASAASGTSRNTMFEGIMQEQMADQITMAQSSLERGTQSHMGQVKGNYDMAMGSAQNLRNQYSANGSQFNLYQQRLANMKKSYDDGQEIQSMQVNYLTKQYDDTSLSLTKANGDFNWAGLMNWGTVGMSGGMTGFNFNKQMTSSFLGMG